MRGLNHRFINDLKDGSLSFFLNQVKSNIDLCLEIRNNYINIYYRGGSLLKIIQRRNDYRFFFDSKYCLNKEDDTNFELLKSLDTKNVNDYIKNFPTMINEMDSWFDFRPKAEREFQHNLLKSNSCIIDIEYQFQRKMRFDMIVFNGDKIVIVENKFGGNSISGKAGIAKHYKDMCDVLLDNELNQELIQSVVNISDTKYRLGLTNTAVNRADINGFEILFLFVDYNKEKKRISDETKLMHNKFPAKILFMDKADFIFDYDNAEDLFMYGA